MTPKVEKSKEELKKLELEAKENREKVKEEDKYIEVTYETFSMGESRYHGRVKYLEEGKMEPDIIGYQEWENGDQRYFGEWSQGVKCG